MKWTRQPPPEPAAVAVGAALAAAGLVLAALFLFSRGQEMPRGIPSLRGERTAEAAGE